VVAKAQNHAATTYHVRLDSAEDRMRAGRLLTGTDLSLVLAAAARGALGHIGSFSRMPGGGPRDLIAWPASVLARSSPG